MSQRKVNIGGTSLPVWDTILPTDLPGLSYVTSVGMTVPSILSVAGSPITSSGTFAVTLANQSANTGLLGPTSGGAAAPTFRALVSNDIPSLDFSKITSGIVPIAQGGTGVSLASTGGASQVLKQVSSGANITVGQLAFSDISGSVAASQLPNPSATTLGGIESLAASSSKWINQISTSGVPSASQPDFTDISGTASTSQIPNLAASKITSGQLALARGGTNADLSATGGASNVLKQVSAGAAITVAQLASTDLSDITSGTWTPVLAGQTTAGTQTYSDQHGVYVKIGNLVYVSCSITLTAFDAATAGNVNVTGLPFTSSSSGPLQFIANAYFVFVSLDAGYSQFVGTIGQGMTRFSLVEIGSNIVQKRLQPANFNNNSSILLTVIYLV